MPVARWEKGSERAGGTGGALHISRVFRRGGNDPSAVVLAHAQEPLYSLLDARIVLIPRPDEHRSDDAMVVGHVLAAEHASNISILRLAGEHILGRGTDCRVASVEAIHLDQLPQVLPGLQEIIVDLGEEVPVSSWVAPGSSRLLLAEHSDWLGQLPQILNGANLLVHEVALHEEV